MFVAARSDKDEATCCNNRAAIILRAGGRNSFRRQLGPFPQRHAPAVFTRVQVDGVKGAPRRLDRGIAVRV